MDSREPDQLEPPAEAARYPSPPAEGGRYTSLLDYVRVVRRRKWLIVAVTAAAAIIAYGYTTTQETKYEATAQLSFRDPLADLDIIGAGNQGIPTQTPIQLAATNAELITSPQVTNMVERDLKKEHDQEARQHETDPENPAPGPICDGDVSGTVGVQTNLVQAEAQASKARCAATLANAYADAARRIGTEDARAKIDQSEQVIQTEIDEAQAATQSEDPVEASTQTVQLSVLQQQLTRVQTLKEITEPVQVVEPAEKPDDPVSPNTERDTLIGTGIGLLLGLLAAFGRDVLDRRLRSAHEVHEELGLPVLSRVTDSALGHPGLARNGLPAMSDADFEAFRMLRMNLGFLAADNPIRSILVTSGLPEEGKSTVSMSLASAAVLAGQRTLLVECDLRRPSFARRLGVDHEPGLADYLLGSAEPQEILQTVDLGEPASLNGGAARDPSSSPTGTIVAIAAGSQVANPAELLISQRFRGFLEKVTKAYDLVVIDGAPFLAVADSLEIVASVDAVLVCVRAQQTTREELRAAHAALSNLPDRPMGAILTGMRRGDPDAYDYYGY
jgi:succinoglycan biosynthesis transport protein ExoP